MLASRIKNRGLSSVSSVFRSKSLEWGVAPESDAIAQAWLESHDRKFGMFIGGEWLPAGDRATEISRAPATGEVLAESAQATTADVDAAVASATTAFSSWSALAPHARARHLYSIARHIQKHSRLLAVIEALDNGKSVRETRDADIPLAVRHFYSHAGWAQLMESDPELSRCAPLGVVGQIIPWNFPLLMLSWKIAPALAMGNTVVIKPAPWTRLSAWAFAEICAEAGLPPGVINVVSGDNEMAAHMAGHDGFKKLAFTGSTGVGKALSVGNAGSGRKLSLELGGKSPVIVYDSADLDAAVEGLVNGVWYNQGQVCCAGSRLLVQESIAEKFVAKVKRRMGSLRTGSSLDKCIDMGAVVDPIQHRRIEEYVEIGRKEGADVFQAECPEGEGFYPATFVTNVQSTSPLVQEEIFGPVLVAQTFRTPEEAVELANNSCFGLSAGVWTESLGLAAETATAVRAGVVWVNGHNKFDAAAGFGGYKESGHGREGGREGLYAYVQPKWRVGEAALGDVPEAVLARAASGAWGKSDPTLPAPPQPQERAGKAGKAGAKKAGSAPAFAAPLGLPQIDRTPKLYVGGKQQRPDHEHSITVFAAKTGEAIGQVADGTRKDIRNAVEAAHAAAPGWGKRAAHNRAQILYVFFYLPLHFTRIMLTI
jgi:aldehyde dehydrogenase (NAD+)